MRRVKNKKQKTPAQNNTNKIKNKLIPTKRNTFFGKQTAALTLKPQ